MTAEYQTLPPFSALCVLFTSEKANNHIFGFELLPIRGYILFITGGEKVVLGLVANGFSPITMNNEAAHIPKSLLRGHSCRFNRIVVIHNAEKPASISCTGFD